MVARKRWRYLAPVALLAVIVATLLVLRAGLAKHDKLPATPPVALTTIHRPHARKRFYVIKPGDSLSAISARTGVSITTLETLNPSVDPSALQAGQRLRLIR
jgi:LysM repeat protein